MENPFRKGIVAGLVWRLLLGVAVLAFLSLFAQVEPFRVVLGIIGVSLLGVAIAHRLSGDPTPALAKGDPSPAGFQFGMAVFGIFVLAAALGLIK
jgi:hypothetical protein